MAQIEYLRTRFCDSRPLSHSNALHLRAMCSIKCCLLLRRLRRPLIHRFSTAAASPSLPRKKNHAGVLPRGAGPPPAPEDTGDAARAHEAAVRRLAAAGDVDGVQLALQEMRLRGVPCTEGALVAAVGAFARAGAPDRALKTFYRAVHDLGCARPTAPRLYNHLIDALLRENLAYSTCSDFEFALPDCECILRRLHAMIPSRGSSGVSKRGS